MNAEPSSMRRPGVAGYLLLLPLAAWLVLFVVAPTAIMLLYSFGRIGPLGQAVLTREGDGSRTLALTWQNYLAIASPRQWAALAICLAAGGAAWLAIRNVSRTRRLALPGGIAIAWALLCAYAFGWTFRGKSVVPFLADPAGPANLKVLVASINFAAISTIVCMIVGYPVAFFIAKARPRWRGLLLLAVMIPFWTSFLVRTYAWVTIFRGNGLLNATLAAFGLPALDLYPSSTAVMVGLIYTYLPFMILPIYASIERLDDAMLEAAFDLGATPLRAFRDVVLPLTRPGIIAGVLLVFVPAVGQFAINQILGGGQDVLIGDLIQRQFGPGRNPPLGAALGILLLGVFVATYLLLSRRRTTNTN